MELKDALQFLGLSTKEAKVYLALLEMGKGTVPAVSKRAETKRPTTYLILDELRKKGLATLVPRRVKAIYTAESPQMLLEEQREKEEIISQKMPELLAIYNSKKEKPKIKFYQGEKWIINLYNDQIFKEKKVRLYGSIDAIPMGIYKQIEKNLEIIEKEGIIVNELLESNKRSIVFKNKYNSDLHKIKIIPEKYKLPTDNAIFGNKVAIFSYKDEPMATVIESSDVVKSYKSMFDMVWESS